MSVFLKDIRSYTVEDLVKMYRNSNNIKSKNIYENIILEKKNDDLIRVSKYISKKIDKFGSYETELYQEACIVLHKCINVFPINNNIKDTSFTKYLVTALNNELNKIAQTESEFRSCIHIDNMSTLKNKDYLDNSNILDNKILISSIKNNLSEREYNVVSNKFGLFGNKELTIDEIKNKFNISKKQVEYALNKGLLKIKESLGEI